MNLWSEIDVEFTNSSLEYGIWTFVYFPYSMVWNPSQIPPIIVLSFY
jgi:hypothetical protein